MSTIVRGITHNGKPHLDECMAAAIIRYFRGDIHIERKSIVTKRELDNPSIIVFDIGGVHNPEKNCFDHHQSPRLPAASTLVWKALHQITTEEDTVLKKLMRPILKSISHDDRGFFRDKEQVSISKIFADIRNDMEDDEAFEYGVDFCEKIIRGITARVAGRKTETEFLWEKYKKQIGPSKKIVQITKELTFVPKDLAHLAKIECVDYVIVTCTRGGVCVVAREGLQLPHNHKYQKEYGFNGYSMYKNENAAINHLMELTLITS